MIRAVLFSACLVIGCSSNRTPEEKLEAERKSQARYFAKEHVRKLFKFPEETSFPLDAKAITMGKDHDVWHVESTATSKNPFGVKTSHTWRATVYTDGKLWYLVRCFIDGETAHVSEKWSAHVKGRE